MLIKKLHTTLLNRIGIILILFSTLQACTYLNLGHELKSAKKNLFFIKANIEASADKQTIAVLFKRSDKANINYVGYRVVSPEQPIFFIVPEGNYHLVAFQDDNNDYKYQQGEKNGINSDIELYQLPKGIALASYISSIQPEAITLTETALDKAYKINLSVSTLQTGKALKKNNYLKVVNFSESRFSMENIKNGMWKPLTFLKEVGYGLYLLEEWNEHKLPLVLIHGINSSPRMWESFINDIDTDKYQIMLYHYPSASSLSLSSYYLREALVDISKRNKNKISFVAHSMGGLVTRGAIQALTPDVQKNIDLFFTMSTPWGGNAGAQFAVETAPIVAPVWKDLTPESQYIKRIYQQALPNNVQHIMLVSYAGNAFMVSEKNDGSVTLSSQLYYPAQEQADKTYLINADHTSIITDKQTKKLARKYLFK